MIISLAAIGLLCASGIGDAQQPVSPLYRIGFLSPTSHGPNIEAFQQGLKELGYIEGRNVVLETRFAEGRLERLPELAANLLSLKVDVIVTGSEPGVRAAKNATTTVPIVFAGITDPLGTGLVASLAHPGDNITGVTFGVAGASLGGKWVELLKEAVPSIARVAALSNASDPQTPPLLRQMENAARALNVELEVFDVRSTGELDKALATIAKSSAQGLIVSNSPVFSGNRAKLSEFAASKRLPAIYFYNLFMDVGGLMSYGSSVEESYRRAAVHVDKIHKGAKPGDLPIEQPTRVELFVNLKAARSLGITIPQSILLRADKVIE